MKLTKEMESLRADGLSYNDIADRLNMSYGSVYNTFVRAGKHVSRRNLTNAQKMHGAQHDSEPTNKNDLPAGDQNLYNQLRERFSKAELQSLLKSSAIAPERGTSKHKFSGDIVTIGALTDLHIGSLYTDDTMIYKAFEEFQKSKVDMVTVSGDITEGLSHRPGHVYECTHVGYSQQLEHAREIFSQWTETPVEMIDGNHDRWYIKSNGALIVEELCRGQENLNFLGHDEGDILINGASVKLWHGEDGSSYAFSYRIQKIVEAFTGGEKPSVLFCGHTHKALYVYDRHIHCVSLGAIQKQSKWMRGKRQASHTGFWIVKMAVNKGSIAWFQPTWYPFYR